MQLGVSFSTLLATLIISLFVLDDVAAAPYKRGPVPGSVTLKLRSVPPRNDIHPELVSSENKQSVFLFKMLIN